MCVVRCWLVGELGRWLHRVVGRVVERVRCVRRLGWVPRVVTEAVVAVAARTQTHTHSHTPHTLTVVAVAAGTHAHNTHSRCIFYTCLLLKRERQGLMCLSLGIPNVWKLRSNIPACACTFCTHSAFAGTFSLCTVCYKPTYLERAEWWHALACTQQWTVTYHEILHAVSCYTHLQRVSGGIVSLCSTCMESTC